MRILALTSIFPNPFQPQRATYNRHRLRRLGDRHPVRVISPIAWTDEWRALRAGQPALPPDRRVTLDGLTIDHPRYLFPPMVARHWYGHFFHASVAKVFRQAVSEFQPDLVFAPWAYPDGWAAVRLGRKVGLPVVLLCHGSDVLLLDKYPSRKRRTIEALTEANGVVAVSQDIANALLRFGVKPERVRVIIDGVNLQVFYPGSKAEARAVVGVEDGPPVVLFVGNLAWVKAVDVLLTACATLTHSGSPVRLMIAGDGPLRSKLEQQTAALGITGQVRFLGSVPHYDLANWFRAADLFALPSHSEGVPNVLLEASACGTPWVASNVGGIPEIAGLGISRLVPPNSPNELAVAIRESLLAPPQSQSNGPKSREQTSIELETFLVERLASFRMHCTQ